MRVGYFSLERTALTFVILAGRLDGLCRSALVHYVWLRELLFLQESRVGPGIPAS